MVSRRDRNFEVHYFANNTKRHGAKTSVLGSFLSRIALGFSFFFVSLNTLLLHFRFVITR